MQKTREIMRTERDSRSDDDQNRATMLAQSISLMSAISRPSLAEKQQQQGIFKRTKSKTKTQDVYSELDNSRKHENCLRREAQNHRYKMRTNQSSSSALIFIASCSTLLLVLTSILLADFSCSAQSVVRPTKFTDVKGPLIGGNQQQQQQQQNNNINNNQAVAAAAVAAVPAAPSLADPQAASAAPALDNNNNINNNKDSSTLSGNKPENSGIIVPSLLSAPSNGRINGANSNPFPAASQLAPNSGSTTIYPVKTRLCSNANGFRHDSPLGMQSYGIDDLALSASSYSNEQTAPHMARLNLDASGGAWCPGKPISGSLHGSEWIQVKLNRSVVITAIETQGRFGMGSGKEFAPGYSIEYSRNGGLSWHKWRDYTGIGVLRGNDDVSTPVKNELTPPIVGANVIRILPFSQHLKTVCLRFELHGCTYDEGAPIAYAGPDGVIEGRWGHLIDTTYDGFRHQGQLHGGLGQLVDGIKGADNFSHNQGLEWVGWKSKDGDLHIEFTFKTLRNFTGALFHSNNLFSSGVEALQAMDVHYGIDIGQSVVPLKNALEEPRRREAALSRTSRQVLAANGYAHHHQSRMSGNNVNPIHNNQLDHNLLQNSNTVWSSKVLRIEYEPDKRLETARPVTVHLEHQLANKLKFVLKFASKWILISEVEFLSHPVELMSFASLSQEHTPPLLDSLKNSKSYDEYVAILREHQLRRIAANAFFGISPTQTSTPTTTTTTTNYIGPSSTSEQANQPEMQSDDQPMANENNPNLPSLDIINNYPTVDPNLMLNKQQQDGQLTPNSPYDNILGRTGSPGGWLSNPPSSSIFNSISYPGLFAQQPSLINEPSLDMSKRITSQTSLTTPITPGTSSSLGFATVISLIIVGMILLITLLIGLSRYHMHRHQPKLGFPGFPFNLGPEHSSSPSGSSSTGRIGKDLAPIKGLVSPLMGVFSHNTNSHSQHHSANNIEHQQHPYQLEPYNTIFAPGRATNSTSSAGSSSNQSSSMSVRNTLGRLAGLSSTSNGAANNRNPQSVNGPHQLLVSVKDTSGAKSSFGFGNQANKEQSVSTQLIVGLNQANPMAHQQIYSNNSSVNCNSNQTYATQYTTASGCGAISMASSSNVGGLASRQLQQGGQQYNEYATPEIGGVPLPTTMGNLRSSCRATTTGMFQGNHFNNNSFTLSNRLLHQQHINNNNGTNMFNENQQQNIDGDIQHNYELIHHDGSNDGLINHQNRQEEPFHARTLGKQTRYNYNQ